MIKNLVDAVINAAGIEHEKLNYIAMGKQTEYRFIIELQNYIDSPDKSNPKFTTISEYRNIPIKHLAIDYKLSFNFNI